MRRTSNITLGHDPKTGLPFLAPTDGHCHIVGQTGTGKSKFVENLCRQFLLKWPKHRSGMLVIDPHGNLIDSLITFLVFHGIDRPIIHIDLRRDDWIVAYNPLRARDSIDPAVIVSEFVAAMAHVWGAANTDETPRFARWVSNILAALYERKLTLLDAETLIEFSAFALRRALTEDLANRRVRQDWAFANALRPADFEAHLGSTINRLQRFLGAALFRRMFGQKTVSLDLHKAIDEGHIILVTLATEGGRVADEHARLFATMLLSDVWAAAKYRGKRAGLKRFDIVLDEFQNFITPTMAANLDQSRGFGLRLLLANQFPQQVLHAGPHGEQVLDSILCNARTKIVFSVEGEENLRPLALSLFAPSIRTDKVKHELYTTKVVGYEEQTRTVHARGTTTGWGKSQSSGHSAGAGSGGTEQFPGQPPFFPLYNLPTSVSRSTSKFSAILGKQLKIIITKNRFLRLRVELHKIWPLHINFSQLQSHLLRHKREISRILGPLRRSIPL